MERAEYTRKFARWTKDEMEDLEKFFPKSYKKFTFNQTTLPDALLKLSREMGGIGFSRLSDNINAAKYSMYQRHLHAGGMISRTMDTLLYNGVVVQT